jgi:hypothetical protein
LLSRPAYERGLKEGADVEVFLQQARLTSRQITNKDIQLGAWCTILQKFQRLRRKRGRAG